MDTLCKTAQIGIVDLSGLLVGGDPPIPRNIGIIPMAARFCETLLY